MTVRGMDGLRRRRWSCAPAFPLPADLLTPVGAYLLVREALGAPAFLLESVERGEQVGRHSFLSAGCDVTDSLDEAVAFAASRPGPGPGDPPFVGGAVGHISYD